MVKLAMSAILIGSAHLAQRQSSLPLRASPFVLGSDVRIDGIQGRGVRGCGWPPHVSPCGSRLATPSTATRDRVLVEVVDDRQHIEGRDLAIAVDIEERRRTSRGNGTSPVQ